MRITKFLMQTALGLLEKNLKWMPDRMYVMYHLGMGDRFIIEYMHTDNYKIHEEL